MSAQKILVLGATGTIGAPLVRQLVAAGHAVKAASREARPVAGAEAVRFDYTDPTTLAPAFAGVDRAFVLLPSGIVAVRESLEPVVRHAAAHGVKVVFLSVFGADADEAIPYRQVERLLEESGTPFVVLRPNWFADNFHTFWKAGLDQGLIALPAAGGRSAFIDARDIAAAAAAALTTDRFDGGAFDLTGPEALDYGAAATLLSETLGRPVRYLPIDDAAFIDALTGAGVPDDYAGFLATIFLPVREGWTARVTDGVQTLTGAPPRDLATYARDHAADLGRA